MEKTEDISSDFILCIQKLLLSISTLQKYLFSLNEKQENTLIKNEESNIRLKVSNVKCFYSKSYLTCKPSLLSMFRIVTQRMNITLTDRFLIMLN